jgi:hypothetical protein
MIREFIGFDEAAALLGSDPEGLRQAYEVGLAAELPVFVYAQYKPLLARFRGKEVSAKAPDIHDATSATIEVPGFGLLTYFDLADVERFGDVFGEIGPCRKPQAKTGHAFLVELRGYFRVAPNDLKVAAREHNVGMVSVAPASWWEADSRVPKLRSGTPAVMLALLPSDDPSYGDMPELADLQFRIADIETFKASRAGSMALAAGTNPPKLRTDREKNYLRVIAGIWELSPLPKVPNAAADKLSALFDTWGWDGPGKSTIADSILKQAASLPRAKK